MRNVEIIGRALRPASLLVDIIILFQCIILAYSGYITIITNAYSHRTHDLSSGADTEVSCAFQRHQGPYPAAARLPPSRVMAGCRPPRHLLHPQPLDRCQRTQRLPKIGSFRRSMADHQAVFCRTSDSFFIAYLC